jgi:hypothetical protein
MVFIGLLVVLFLGQVFMNEGFKDTDASGNISLSLSDLMALLGSGSGSGLGKGKGKDEDDEDDYDSSGIRDKYYRNMRADMMDDVKRAVKKELLNSKFSELYGSDSGSDGTTLDDSCIDSFSSQQGSDFMKYIPGKNPDDYIRKDSVPCYGCSIP